MKGTRKDKLNKIKQLLRGEGKLIDTVYICGDVDNKPDNENGRIIWIKYIDGTFEYPNKKIALSEIEEWELKCQREPIVSLWCTFYKESLIILDDID